MKLLLICLLLGVGTMATAQNMAASRLETRIEDDGKILSIQIDGFKNERQIHYKRSFDVAGMNRLQKEVLKCRVFYAQGLAMLLREVSGLLFAVPGLAALAIGFLVAGYRTWKANQQKTLKTLPSQ